MPPAKDHQPVQALAVDTGDPAFAQSIRIRCPYRCVDGLQAFGSKDGIEGGWKVAVERRGPRIFNEDIDPREPAVCSTRHTKRKHQGGARATV